MRFDPFASLDPIANLERQWQQTFDPVFTMGARAVGRPPTIPLLEPEEEESILGKITSPLLGGIGWVGGTLDKAFGGRAIRGLLGGRPRELLSAIPLPTDAMGITDPEDRVSGEDLLRKGGFINDDPSWLNTGLGIAAEIALDPSTYMTFGAGALTKGGQVAKRLNVLPKSMSGRIGTTLGSLVTPANQQAAEAAAKAVGARLPDILGQRLGGLMGLGLPFAEPSVVLGAGSGGEKFLQGVGTVGSMLRNAPGVRQTFDAAAPYAASIGRGLQALFDRPAWGQTGVLEQKYARELFENVEKTRPNQVYQPMADIMRAAQPNLDEIDQLRAVAENVHTQIPAPGIQQAADIHGRLMKQALAKENALGIPTKAADDYMMRQAIPVASEAPLYARDQHMGGAPFSTVHPSLKKREDIIKIPGGTPQFERMVRDPEVSTVARTLSQQDAARKIGRDYLGLDWNELAALKTAAQAGQLSLAQQARLLELSKYETQAAKLSDFLGTMGKERLKVGFFGDNPLMDIETRLYNHNLKTNVAQMVHRNLAEAAVPAAHAPAGSRPLTEILKEMGLTHNDAATKVGSLYHQQQLLGSKGLVKDMMVPPDVAHAMTNAVRAFTMPEVLQPLTEAFSQWTNLTKAWQTARPAFNVRNFVSGLWQNFVIGATDPRMANPVSAFLRPMLDARKLLDGKVVEGANQIPWLRHLTDAEATKVLADTIFKHNVAGRHVAQAAEVVNKTIPSAQELMERIPGTYHSFDPMKLGDWQELGKRALPQKGKGWDQVLPWAVRGVGGRSEDAFAPIASMRWMGQSVEDTNRIAAFIAKARQGYVPEGAAAMSKAAHFDYSALTPFERRFIRPFMVPFYTWTRNNIPFQLKQLMEHPGGVTATVAKVGANLRGQGFVPEYLGKGLAIPVGGEQDGTQRYLTRSGLPFEDVFEFATPNQPAQMLMTALSHLNPAIKGPLEFATGKQFYSGRDLEDLYSVTGSPVAEQLIMNSPMSSYWTLGRTLIDPRKWENPLAMATNVFTGTKLSDVDVEKQRNLAARDAINDLLRGQQGVRRFETMYVKPEDLPFLSPQELALVRLSKTLEARAKDRAKKKAG